MSRVKVATVQDLPEGAAVKFQLETGAEAFVICWKGKYLAYRNVCRHVTLPLDYGDGEFFSSDGRWLVCHNHGAQYEPDTGLCVQGPCAGKSLQSLDVVQDGEDIFVELDPS